MTEATQARSSLLTFTSRTCVRAVVIGAGAALLIALYVYGAVRQASVQNVSIDTADQHTFVRYARQLWRTNYTYIGNLPFDGYTGNRNQMPVYPFLQSLFYDPDLSDLAFWEQGKLRNIALSMILLAGIGAIFWRRFGALHALPIVLITGFTVFMFKAGYFQPELLFYFLAFVLFLSMSQLIVRPSWKLAAATGALAGVAYLTKASTQPALAVLVSGLALQTSIEAIRARRSAPDEEARLTAARGGKRLLHAGLVILVFLTVLFPYISTSKRVFGRWFYNVNTTFYIWYDAWADVKAEYGTFNYGDTVGWPTVPPEHLPSMGRYFRERTSQQIATRLGVGAYGALRFHCREGGYGYCLYFFIYTGFTYAAIVYDRPGFEQRLKRNPFLALFWVLYFGAYLLLYAFYAAIAAGPRFMLSLWLPYLFVLSVILQHSALYQATWKMRGRPIRVSHLFNGVVLAMLAVDLYFIMTQRIVTVFAGP